LVGSQANAFIVEPFLSYEMGEADNGTASVDATGTTFGVRAGGSTLGFIYGLEYQTGSITVEDPAGDEDYDLTDMGVFVGFEFPVLIRAYATYYFSHKAEPPTGSDIEGDGGIKLGVGFTGLPFVSINLEKMTRAYDKSGGATIDQEIDTTILSVSLPLP
jgi:hypothetical protein